MANKIQLRRDSSSNWTSVNPVLSQGEIGIDLTNMKIKIGNGTTAWNSLAYWDDKVTDLSSFAGDIVPSDDNTYSLGSPEKQWKDLFVSNGSVYIGDIKLSNNNGQLVVQQVTNPGEETEEPVPDVPGSVTTDRLVNGVNTFVLKDDGAVELNGEPFTDGGGANTGNFGFSGNVAYNSASYDSGLYIAPGGESTSDIYVPGNAESATIAAHIVNNSETGRVYIGAHNKQFNFNADGTFQLPAGGDIVDSNGDSVLGGEGGSPTVKTNIELTNEAAPLDIWAGEWVEFVKTDGGSEVDEIDTGLSITRGNNQGIYNSALEEGYDDSYGDPDGRASPKGTVWNKTGGWGDLSNVATRTYDTFYNIHGGNIGGQVLTGQYVMKDVANSTYYKVDFTVWGNANNGAPVSYTRTQIDPADGSFIGDPVEFVKLGYADPFLVYDAVSSEVHISRGNNQSIFNTVSEQGYNGNWPGDGDGENSPEGTLWNLEGWRNLTDVKQRTYLPWVEMFDWAIGMKILNSECVMYDTANNKYYALKFTSWTGGNNGGGFAYRRRLINTDLIFVHTEGGDEVDDIAENIGITRDTNYGIYNPYDEGSWDDDVSPGGTEWSFAGNHDLSDIETRHYQPFWAAQNYYGIGNRIEGREAVMRLTGTSTYYTIKFLYWQAGGGGAFSYIRTPVDLAKINEGIRFADGTVQKTSASDPVKFRGPIGRTIEEYYGYKEVRITEAAAYTLDTTARGNRDNDDTVEFDVPDEQTQQDLINGAMRNVSVSVDDGVTWIALRPYYAYSGNNNGYYVAFATVGYAQTITYNNGDNIKIRYWRGGEPQLWFDPAASPGGRGNFRGAIIQYHAFCDQAGTIVGTIMVANDDGDYNVTHSEVASGGSDVANVNLWYSERSADDYNWNRSEGKLYAYRVDGDNDTIKIQWRATMFYGQEFWD